MEPRWGGLPAHKLQPGELRQRATLLQEPGRQHRLPHLLQTGGLCAGGAAEVRAAGEGEYPRGPYRDQNHISDGNLSWLELGLWVTVMLM